MDKDSKAATGFAQPLEAEWLDRARAGDRAAQALIYRRYERAVYTLLRRMVDCADTAADLLQDSFLDAYARIHQFRGESPFGYWLRAVAASRALMHLRGQRRFLELFAPEAEVERVPSFDVHQLDLERALAVLPPLPRAVLWLYHVEGYTHAEIAAMNGKTESFSKSQLARAHQKLRELLGVGEPSPATRATPHTPASPPPAAMAVATEY
ncbi:sigma-70 family RNA polymerase sigma factor [Stagnimonas aquatica]|uniref:Sigma-70 family RNA polymerase sigma factor n=1 Tax=Stagnimonas aquatica TaxID=2689987 RepID=A0A3N0V7J8_9GAMM|nr:sigma-70 family RNA polymerase sigma factor [Stagnimonas aquatica]ROH88776.1 sigma-70 family RNA polymerase sigma factor [Stagnimonas aquatica]